MSYFKAILQDVKTDTNNTLHAGTINAGVTWNTGGTPTPCVGYGGVQVTVKADQNLIVYIDQYTDVGDLMTTDSFSYNVLKDNFGVTVKVHSDQVLVRAKNVSLTNASNVHVHTNLAPISEPLPRSLDENGYLKVAVYENTDEFGNKGKISPMGTLNTDQPYRLVGTSFGSSIDTSFWTASNNGTGSASGVANSISTVTSGTAASAWGNLVSVRSGRFIFAHPHKYRSICRITNLSQTNTIRRWGAYSSTAGGAGTPPTVVDGFYFEFDGADTLSVNTRNNGGTVNSVPSGSFNGDVSSYSMDTNSHAYEIVFFLGGAQFFIDNELIHTFIPTTSLMTATCSLPVGVTAIKNTTTDANTGTIEMWAGIILRLGRDISAPMWINRAGAVTAAVAKSGPGVLRGIIINSAVAGTVTLYDALTATNPIATITTINNQPSASYPFNMDFYTGLTYTTSVAGHNITLVFE